MPKSCGVQDRWRSAPSHADGSMDRTAPFENSDMIDTRSVDTLGNPSVFKGALIAILRSRRRVCPWPQGIEVRAVAERRLELLAGDAPTSIGAPLAFGINQIFRAFGPLALSTATDPRFRRRTSTVNCQSGWGCRVRHSPRVAAQPVPISPGLIRLIFRVAPV